MTPRMVRWIRGCLPSRMDPAGAPPGTPHICGREIMAYPPSARSRACRVAAAHARVFARNSIIAATPAAGPQKIAAGAWRFRNEPDGVGVPEFAFLAGKG